MCTVSPNCRKVLVSTANVHHCSAERTAGHLIGQQCHTSGYAFLDLPSFFFQTTNMHNMQDHRPSPPHCQHRVSALSTHDLCKPVQGNEQTQNQQCTGCPGSRVIPIQRNTTFCTNKCFEDGKCAVNMAHNLTN